MIIVKCKGNKCYKLNLWDRINNVYEISKMTGLIQVKIGGIFFSWLGYNTIYYCQHFGWQYLKLAVTLEWTSEQVPGQLSILGFKILKFFKQLLTYIKWTSEQVTGQLSLLSFKILEFFQQLLTYRDININSFTMKVYLPSLCVDWTLDQQHGSLKK